MQFFRSGDDKLLYRMRFLAIMTENYLRIRVEGKCDDQRKIPAGNTWSSLGYK